MMTSFDIDIHINGIKKSSISLMNNDSTLASTINAINGHLKDIDNYLCEFVLHNVRRNLVEEESEIGYHPNPPIITTKFPGINISGDLKCLQMKDVAKYLEENWKNDKFYLVRKDRIDCNITTYKN